MTTTYLLTGDIGGTNSRMSLYDTSSSTPLAIKFYSNEERFTDKSDGSFEKLIVAPFLQNTWKTVKTMAPIDKTVIIACFACAGPVSNNKVLMSNLGVTVDGHAIENNVYCNDIYVQQIVRALIINDFVAQGYGCLTLKPNEVKELTPNSHKMTNPMGPKVCVGAGTGLGECYLTPDGEGVYNCFPSEGGHVEFNPRTALEIKMRAYMMKNFQSKTRLSIERVVSGKGLANVYEFLAKECPSEVDEKVHKEFLEAADLKGKVVAVNASAGSLCKRALDIMVAAYGSEVGSAAIKWIPTGGLYVTGGLTPKNIQHIEGKTSKFMMAYGDKGRASSVLKNVPLFAVMVEDLGVRGAHKGAVQEYERLTKQKETPGGATAVAPASHSSLPKEVGPSVTDSRISPTFLVMSTIFAVACGVLVGMAKK